MFYPYNSSAGNNVMCTGMKRLTFVSLAIKFKGARHIFIVTLLLDGQQNTNSKWRVGCVLFIHAGEASNARHMSRTRFEHAQGSQRARWYARFTRATCPRHVRCTSRLMALRQCASQSTPLVRQKLAHNSLWTRSTSVWQDRTRFDIRPRFLIVQGCSDFVIFFSKRPAHTPMCDSTISPMTS